MKKGLIIVFVLLLALAWYTAISEVINNPKEFKKHLEAAEDYLQKEIYIEAIAEYEAALEYEPNNLEISLKLADSYLKINEESKFENICEHLAIVHQDSEVPIDTLMNYYIADERELSAVKYLKTFLADYPENVAANRWMRELKGSYEILYCFYESMSDFVFDNMIVSEEGSYGIADEKGEIILDTKYEEVNHFSESDMALVKEDGKYRYVDRDGLTRLVPDSSIENVGMISSDRTYALKNGKYAYLNEKLEPVTDFAWEGLTLLAEGIGAGKKNGKWALLNENGEEKTEYIYDDIAVDEYGFCSVNKRIFAKMKKSYYLLNTKGETVSELKFDSAKPFASDKLAAVCMKGKWGFVNTEGELVLECKYEDAKSFSNGYASVCIDGKWGYIDSNGHLIINPIFEFAGSISSAGTAVIYEEEQWKLIQLNIFK